VILRFGIPDQNMPGANANLRIDIPACHRRS